MNNPKPVSKDYTATGNDLKLLYTTLDEVSNSYEVNKQQYEQQTIIPAFVYYYSSSNNISGIITIPNNELDIIKEESEDGDKDE